MKISSKQIVGSSWGLFKFVILMLFYLILATSYQLPIYAEEATGSVKAASTSASIQEKIQLLKDEIASKAAVLKQQVNIELSNRLAAGQIIEISKTKIIVNSISKSERGDTKTQTILVNEYTDYTSELKKNSSLDLSDLKRGDFIIGLGDMDDQANLTSKKVVLSTPPTFSKKVVWGVVNQVSPTSLDITDRDHQNRNFTLSTKTNITSGATTMTITDLKVGKTVVVSAIAEKTGDLATLVYLVPTNSVFKQTLEATRSTATKAATKKPN